MNELQLKKLYRRIERASRLTRHTWYRRFAALLGIMF